MALQRTSKDQITAAEDDLLDVVNSLRKMRQEWAEKGVPEVDLEVDKALKFIEYLKNTWTHRVYAQFRQGLAKESARVTKDKFRKK